MNVVNVISDSNIGGAGIALLNYLKYANRTEFSHTVVVPENSLLTDRLRGLDIAVREVAGIAEKSLSAGAIGALRREYVRLEPDIVHTHASLSARIAARWYGRCAIVHTRHCAYPVAPYKKVFPARQLLGMLNNALSDRIIAISPSAAENLTDMGTDPERVFTMFNGVEPVRELSGGEKTAARARYGVRDGEFVCAIVARLVPEKGHVHVLDAAELLRGLPVRILIAGGGDLEGELRESARSRGLDNCAFLGFVEDVAAVENIADVQINASVGTETSSLSILESLSLGIPAIVSDSCGNPHLIADGENGIVVPQGDGAAIASAVRRLQSDPALLARMGAKAREVYESRFTGEIMAENIENVYRGVRAAQR